MATATRTKHRYLETPDGHTLRLTQWQATGPTRTVYLKLEDGALVELGYVTMVTRDQGFAHPVDVLGTPGWACSSFQEGAQLLDARIDVTPMTTYALRLRS